MIINYTEVHHFVGDRISYVDGCAVITNGGKFVNRVPIESIVSIEEDDDVEEVSHES